MPAETPATPAPIIATSSTSACNVSRFWKSGSFRIARSAFVAVSDENFSSGIPERSPAIRTPGRLVIPFSPVTGNFSTAPAGQRVCSHWLYTAMPHTKGCEECLKMGDTWVHLRLCMECGHVGCCDSSKNKHATKHFHRTKHPIMRSLEPGENWGWCFVDDLELDFS